MVSFSVGNGAMNAPRYGQQRKYCLNNIAWGATVFVAALPIVMKDDNQKSSIVVQYF
jgi:hypothetical protein